MIFNYKHKKGNISPGIIIENKKLKNGTYLSCHPEEKEVILFPFTFAKITDIKSETEKGFKASLRSNDYVNVSDICLLFNGGGHIKAAGCTLPYSLDESKERILNAAKRFLK